MGRDELSLYVSRNDAPSDGEVDAPSWSWNCQAWWAAKVLWNPKLTLAGHANNQLPKTGLWWTRGHQHGWRHQSTFSSWRTHGMATDLLTQKSVMTQKVTKTVFDRRPNPVTLCVLSATQSAPHRVTLCVLSATQCPVSSMLLSVQCPQCYSVSSVLSATQCPVSSVLPSVQCPPTQWHCSCDRSSWNEEGGATSSVTAPRCQTHWVGQQTWLLILTIKQDLNIAKWAKQSNENDTRPTRGAKRQKMFSEFSSGLLPAVQRALVIKYIKYRY